MLRVASTRGAYWRAMPPPSRARALAIATVPSRRPHGLRAYLGARRCPSHEQVSKPLALGARGHIAEPHRALALRRRRGEAPFMCASAHARGRRLQQGAAALRCGSRWSVSAAAGERRVRRGAYRRGGANRARPGTPGNAVRGATPSGSSQTWLLRPRLGRTSLPWVGMSLNAYLPRRAATASAAAPTPNDVNTIKPN
eukprot:scaffold3036_cov414-Prasinococcus_capsulatus_cf.AAC.10